MKKYSLKFHYVVVCLLSATFFIGCSTLSTVSVNRHGDQFECIGNHRVTRIYSGVSNDISFLRGGYNEQYGVPILDMPFSFIADTIILPYTIYTQIRFGNICPKKSEAAQSK